jgi:hypothetical protein
VLLSDGVTVSLGRELRGTHLTNMVLLRNGLDDFDHCFELLHQILGPPARVNIAVEQRKKHGKG